MKNLCLFLSMDEGLVSDTQLIYPLKIAESRKMGDPTKREGGSGIGKISLLNELFGSSFWLSAILSG